MALAITTTARAEVPPQLQALLLLRSLAYDHNIKTRGKATTAVTVAVLAGADASDGGCAAIQQALEAAAAQRVTVAGMPLVVLGRKVGDLGALEAELRTANVSAIYVCRALGKQASALSQLSRKLAILSYAASEDMLEHGFSVAFAERGGKPLIVVVAAAVKAEGAALDSTLLAIADVRR